MPTSQQIADRLIKRRPTPAETADCDLAFFSPDREFWYALDGGGNQFGPCSDYASARACAFALLGGTLPATYRVSR